MATVDRTRLVTGRSSTAELVASGLLALSGLAFLAAWATIFQWLDEAGTYLGLGLFDLFGLGLGVLAVGIAGLGLGSRLGHVDGQPDETAGAGVALVFGFIWALVGWLAAGALLGAGTLASLSIALLVGVVAGAASLFPREDVGSTLPVAALLGLLSALVLTDVLDATLVWEPGWTTASFPGAELIPVVVMLATLIAVWCGAKARAGYGAQGRQSGAFALIGAGVFGMLGVLGLLIAFIVVKGMAVFLTGASFLGGKLVTPGALTISEVGLSIPFPRVAIPFPEIPFVANPPGGLFVDIPGVMPAILGTLWLVLGAMLLAVPLGVGAAIFLTEYAEQGRFTQVVEVATNGLWSTPSIVFGLFGLAFLVPRISGGKSIIVGQLVLSFMLLPLVLITSREAIKSVPDEYRDASAALGVSQWQTVRSVVIPAAMPGVITGVIIGVGRIAGETAPLLLVFGGSPFPSASPNVIGSFRFTAAPPFVTNDALLSRASALPYQLYTTITAGQFPSDAFTSTEFGWGVALVLLLVVIGLYAIGVGSRIYFRRKLNYE